MASLPHRSPETPDSSPGPSPALAAPPSRHPPVPDAPLDRDLPCAHCGYNLRTRRPSDRCPECNLPVSVSIEAFGALPLRFAPRFATVARLFAVLYSLALVLGVLGMLTNLFWNAFARVVSPFLMNAVWMLVSAAGYTTAYLLLMRLAQRVVGTPPRMLLFSFAAALVLIGNLLGAMIALDSAVPTLRLFRPTIPRLLLLSGVMFVIALSRLVLEALALAAMRDFHRHGALAPLRSWTVSVLGLSIATHALIGVNELAAYVSLVLRHGSFRTPVEYAVTGVTLLAHALLLVYWRRAARLARQEPAA